MSTSFPTFFPSPNPESLHALADGLLDFANAATEILCYDDHTELLLWEAKLRSYADLLRAIDRDTFLTCELQAAEQLLTAIRDQHPEMLFRTAAENHLTATGDSAHDLSSNSHQQEAHP